MAMNTGLQKHTVKKKLRNKGISPEQIDLEAELDSSLTLTENIQNLENKYGKMERTGRNYRGRQEQAQKQRRDQVKKEAKRINKKRPKYNRYVDATKTAETVYADPSERQFEKWKENPNKYDIKGVDTRRNPSERPQTELPIQRNQKNTLYRGSSGELKKSMRKIPGTITSNLNGPREQVAEMKKDQGIDERLKDINELGARANASVEGFDIPEVIEEERKAKRSRANPLRNKGQDKEKLALAINEQGTGDNIREIGPIVNTEDKINKEQKRILKKRRSKKDYRLKKKEQFENRKQLASDKGLLEADSESRASKMLKDSREISDVGKNIRGNTSEKSSQESLRDGYVSKDSEKTLEKWDGNYI